MFSKSNVSNNGIGSDMLYDPIMEPLIQSSLAHFLYMKKNNMDMDIKDKIPDLKTFHPNYIRFQFMDNLIANKASVTLGSFKLYEFTPGTSSMDRGKLMLKVDALLQNQIIRMCVGVT